MKPVTGFILASTFLLSAFAAEPTKLRMSYQNEDITTVIENYSKVTGQKFIIDPSVRGKITIFNSTEGNVEEAFSQLSTALALNGFAIVKQGDTFVIMSARNAQRNNIEVVSELASMKPERMVSLIITLKNVPASSINHQLRILSSRDGEITYLENTNQMVITDWTTNLQRVMETIKKVDIPVSGSIAKFAAQAKKERDERAARSQPADVKKFAPPTPPAEVTSH